MTPGSSAPSVAPAVSVIIPAFGVNAYIEEAVDSVMRQTFSDFEILVVNDGAPAAETEELKSILSPYRNKLRYLERENGGQGAARNTAIGVSSSEFVAFLDGDDFWSPQFLERQMELFQADPELALAYTDLHLFGNTALTGSTYFRSDPSIGEVTLESLLDGRCNVAMSSIVVRREKVLEAGGFDERLRYCEDVDLWFRMAHRRMRMTYRPEALVYRRIRSDALSQSVVRMNAVAVDVIERFVREHEVTATERAASARSIKRLQDLSALIEAKEQLLLRDYDSAVSKLEGMQSEYVSWKVVCARLGLRLIPNTVRLTYELMQRLHGIRLWPQRPLPATVTRPGTSRPSTGASTDGDNGQAPDAAPAVRPSTSRS